MSKRLTLPVVNAINLSVEPIAVEKNEAVASIRPAISAWGTMDGSSDFVYKECICNAHGRSLQ